MPFDRILELLKRCDSAETVMPPTELFSEGWMLRLMIDRFEHIGFPNRSGRLIVPPKLNWYCEPLLPTAFPPKVRSDRRGEFPTHADCVIGDFSFRKDTRVGLKLNATSKHFVVIEAKMFSELSASVTNARNFNQAARTVACIAETLRLAGLRPDDLTIGFYVLAPKALIAGGKVTKHLDRTDLSNVVRNRATDYGDDRLDWFEKYFEPVLDNLSNNLRIEAISWEELIGFLPDDPHKQALEYFYGRCLDYNGLQRGDKRSSSTPV